MTPASHRYFIVNKPYDMHSQFTGVEGRPMLGDLGYPFPEGTHCIGRLDHNSEGLLILTTNKKITRLLFKSEKPHRRRYLLQVYRELKAETLKQLEEGVVIRVKDNGIYKTAPCQVTIVEKPANLFQSGWEYPDNIPQTWLLMTLTEGKFRQIRKMMTVVKHRCLRLIRLSIENLSLENLQPGEVREIPEGEFFERIFENQMNEKGISDSDS
ncbi:pseudouridine synthase [Runella sp.]|uniref:pseudouridine synthase n=1 Tax=Runella sp. TaxID=1960881 RepID=UPI003D0C2FB2